MPLKKSGSDLGGPRGRIVPQADRQKAVCLIEEAKKEGARIRKACDCLGISVRTYKRWKSGKITDQRKGAEKNIPRKLTQEERQAIIDVCCSREYQDLTPYEIEVMLLDANIYLGSVSTMYRTLRSENRVHFRGNTRKGTKTYRPPERVATGPNQVWAWDITYLKTSVAGIYFYLYTIIDVWSRKIVGWSIEDSEHYEHSERLFTRVMKSYGLKNVFLHSDNGNPMKAGTMLRTLYKLGIIPSFSRPRVSNDNAYIESFFKTLKYRKSYPQFFETIEVAQYWVADFLDWYNDRHLHSSIGYVTPIQKHSGLADQIIAA
jgi:transposase InsO family protein